MTRLELYRLKTIRGNYSFDFACSMSRGHSGGLISMWDTSLFVKSNLWCDDNFIIVQGKWYHSDVIFYMVNVYGPQDSSAKSSLWQRLHEFISNNQGSYVICGDFNEVCIESERCGSIFSHSEAQAFNSFIDNSGLSDIPMGGRLYTWMNKAGSKLSKLDRFLLSHDVTTICPDLKAIVLDRLWSDHNPILLHIDKTDFGPIPFKFYNSWIRHGGFDNLIKCKNEEYHLIHQGHVSLKQNLKFFKTEIKEWCKQSNLTNASRLHVILSTLNDLDKKIDSSTATDEDLQSRFQLMKERDNLDRLLSLDLAQKAKLQWDVEGDENSKFFHRILKQKRRHQSIHGILIEGEWITNPLTIKEEFYKFYKSKFKSVDSSFDVNSNPGFTTLFSEDVTVLQQQATFDEIRKDVWDCGSSKSSGPDGFSFLFIKTYWDLFEDDIVNFVNHFMKSGTMPKGTNSAFITLIPKTSNPILIKDYRPISLIGMQYKIIAKLLANRLSTVLDKLVSPTQSAFISGRQILDGPFMVSEIIEWYKKRNKRLMIFKVDFEKAFDSVSWTYLDFILSQIGFGVLWRSWIRACLTSSRTSILVNGSPTPEFFLERGLRQGDPLSSFLFILIMEGLHLILENDRHAKRIKGATVGNPSINLSHFFFADDVMIVSDWDTLDLQQITNSLNSFYCASDKFKSKLSKWKASLLSIGGRFTLIKSVLGSLGIYYLSIFKALESVINILEKAHAKFFWGGSNGNNKMAWVKWDNVLASHDQGGLGIGSLKAFNLALLQKWRWRLVTNPDLLWVKLIKAIHGSEAGFYGKGCATSGLWSAIIFGLEMNLYVLDTIVFSV
ncbi:putative RNA-directed DNA polymerase, eukaryota, reverse transcriptase zinc-binding domain protein [Tanacetum coccineum]